MTERTDLTAVPLTRFQKAVKGTVLMVVPQRATKIDRQTQKRELYAESYAKHYNCCPPPLFIIIVSAVEVCVRECLYLSISRYI